MAALAWFVRFHPNHSKSPSALSPAQKRTGVQYLKNTLYQHSENNPLYSYKKRDFQTPFLETTRLNSFKHYAVNVNLWCKSIVDPNGKKSVTVKDLFCQQDLIEPPIFVGYYNNCEWTVNVHEF